MNISAATAKAHAEALYQRLDVNSRNAAVYKAISRGATLGWTMAKVRSMANHEAPGRDAAMGAMGASPSRATRAARAGNPDGGDDASPRSGPQHRTRHEAA